MSSKHTTVADVAKHIESIAPLALQEHYDNAGLLVGLSTWPVNAVLVTLDVTPEVVNEAIEQGANLIVAHHPLIFSGLKKLTGKNYVQRAVMMAIKHDVAIYAAHTNLDSAPYGVSHAIAQRLGLQHTRKLRPQRNALLKLVTFVPEAHLNTVRAALFGAGVGNIGNYDCCSFGAAGHGTFRASEKAHPFVGNIGELHTEAEIRLEAIVPRHQLSAALTALEQAHPYEEVAYDIIALENTNTTVGLGLMGKLPEPMHYTKFLQMVKQRFNAPCLRHTAPVRQTVSRIAFCGGSGADMLPDAIAQRADVYLSSDFKYHQFFDADGQIMAIDIGHYEIEHCTIELMMEHLTKKFTTFAVRKSAISTNPINYI